MNHRALSLTLGLVVTGLMPMASAADKPSSVPLAASVDLPRFMGDWYVIGIIPNFIEKKAYNSVERYKLNEDGTIATTFSYRKGGFDGPLKTMTPRGFVEPGTNNALWGMQVFWPIRGEYRIAHIEPDYSTTIIGRSALDYVWLMSRAPQMSDAAFENYRTLIGGWGYDVTKFVRVPQQWPEAKARGQ
ncbi:MAG: lipocalin family protein [Pseudomonadota bacterium]